MGAGQSTVLRGKGPFTTSLDEYNQTLKTKYAGGRRTSMPRTVTYDPSQLVRLPLADGNRRDALRTLRGLLDAIVVANDGDVSVLSSSGTGVARQNKIGRDRQGESLGDPEFSGTEEPHRLSTSGPSVHNKRHRMSQGSTVSAGVLNALSEAEVYDLYAPYCDLCFANSGIDDAAVLTTRIPIPGRASQEKSAGDTVSSLVVKDGEGVEEKARMMPLGLGDNVDSPLHNGSGDAAGNAIPALRLLAHHPYLVSLDLSFNALTGASVAAIVAVLCGGQRSTGGNPCRCQPSSMSLRRLSLAGNPIGLEGCQALGAWLSAGEVDGTCCPLEVLSVFHCELDDDATEALLGGLANPRVPLKVLDVNFNYHTPERSLMFLRDVVLPANHHLAVVCMENVRYDPETLTACPIDGEKRIAQACTPVKGGFRPMTANPFRSLKPSTVSKHQQNASADEETAARDVHPAEDCDASDWNDERAKLRRRFLHSNLAGICPVPHTLLDDILRVLEPRRLAYVQQLEKVKASALESVAAEAIQSQAIRQNYGMPLRVSTSASGATDSEDALSFGIPLPSDPADGIDTGRGVGGSVADREEEGEALSPSHQPSKSHHDRSLPAVQQQCSLSGGATDLSERSNDRRRVASAVKTSPAETVKERMSRKYASMESPERLAAVMADAHAFRDRHNPNTSTVSTQRTATEVTSRGMQRLIARGDITPFRYKNGFDVIVEMPRSTARKLRVFDPSTIREEPSPPPSLLREGGEVRDGNGKHTSSAQNRHLSSSATRTTSCLGRSPSTPWLPGLSPSPTSTSLPVTPIGRASSVGHPRFSLSPARPSPQTTTGFTGSPERKLRAAAHDIVRTNLRPCWCQPHDATAVYGGVLHYHCRHEGCGSATCEDTRAHHATATRLPSLVGGGEATASSSEQRSASYRGCRATGHRCASANRSGAASRAAAVRSANAAKQRSYAARGSAAGSTSAGTAVSGAAGSAAAAAGLSYNPITYFSAPYQHCAVIADECDMAW